MSNKKYSNLNTNPLDPYSIMNQASKSNADFMGGSLYRGDRLELINLLTEKHMIETLERFEWYGLPEEIDQDIIERILYFRGKGAFFKFNDLFWFLPFTLKGNIDSYGRWATITPVMFTGQWNQEKKKWDGDMAFLPPSITDDVFTVAYNTKQLVEDEEKAAVILTDRSLAISQDIEASNTKIRVLIERLVNTLIMIETNNINGLQTYALWVQDEAQKLAVEAEFNAYNERILRGERITVIVGDMATEPFKEMTKAQSISDSQRYWQSYQAWDNLRKEIIGIANGGQHLKMEHSTDAETEMSSTSASAVMNNALRMRLNFCDIINAQFGLSVSVNSLEEMESSLIEDEGAQSAQINDEEVGSDEL